MLLSQKFPLVMLVLACALLQACTSAPTQVPVLSAAEPERAVSEVFNEGVMLGAVYQLHLAETGAPFTHIDQVAPDWLKEIPSGWALEGEAFVYRAPAADASQFCADWANLASRVDQCTAVGQTVQVTVSF